jgi:hypothetical protein
MGELVQDRRFRHTIQSCTAIGRPSR